MALRIESEGHTNHSGDRLWMQPSPLPTLEHEHFNSIQIGSMQFGDALMSDSHGSDASTCVPQAHDDFSGRLRGTVAGGPESSSAGMAQMEAHQFNSGMPHNQIHMHIDQEREPTLEAMTKKAKLTLEAMTKRGNRPLRR